MGAPSTIDDASVCTPGGQVEQRVRGADVADLLEIFGEDIHGAYIDPAPYWKSLRSDGSVGRDSGHRIPQAQFGGKTADLEYSCDGQVTSITYIEGSGDRGLEFENTT